MSRTNSGPQSFQEFIRLVEAGEVVHRNGDAIPPDALTWAADEIERLRKALEWYADELNWRDDRTMRWTAPCWMNARHALESGRE